MSTTTPNLGLFKYNTTTDANLAFNINTALNANWDKIDTAMAGGGLPDQTDKDGYVLTTNGSEASWGETAEVHCVIKTFQDNYDWYRVYSDGWCEQGGQVSLPSNSNLTVTFINPFKTIDYNISAIIINDSSYNYADKFVSVRTINNTSITLCQRAISSAAAMSCRWYACGYIEVE